MTDPLPLKSGFPPTCTKKRALTDVRQWALRIEMIAHLYHKLKQWASKRPLRNDDAWDAMAKAVLVIKAGYYLLKLAILLCAV